MSEDNLRLIRSERGVGLIEVLISIVIGMLLVLIIYQVYEVSEGQKRTITGGSDAQQNASYGLYVLARDIAIAGNGIASAAAALQACPFDAAAPDQSLAPIPVIITAGATANDPDTITVFYGGSSSLSTPVPLRFQALPGAPYIVPSPVGFSADLIDPDKTDVIVAVQGATCRLSTINRGGVAVAESTGFATLTHTPLVGDSNATYDLGASVVNLGQKHAMGRVSYTVDTTGHALRTKRLLPEIGLPIPVVNDVVYLKAQYGLDTTAPLPDGIIDKWQSATDDWTPTALAALGAADRLAKVRQVLAVRVAIVTRSAQCELDKLNHECIVLTPGPLTIFDKLLDDDDKVKMELVGDQRYYRYKVLSTIVPLRNSLWNSQ